MYRVSHKKGTQNDCPTKKGPNKCPTKKGPIHPSPAKTAMFLKLFESRRKFDFPCLQVNPLQFLLKFDFGIFSGKFAVANSLNNICRSAAKSLRAISPSSNTRSRSAQLSAAHHSHAITDSENYELINSLIHLYCATYRLHLRVPFLWDVKFESRTFRGRRRSLFRGTPCI